MGKTESKIENPNANVINDIVIKMEFPTYYLIILICLMIVQILINLYQLHKRSIKKNYARRMASVDNLSKV